MRIKQSNNWADHDLLVSGTTTDITGNSSTLLITAPVAPYRLYLTHLIIQNSHASTATWVSITDGDGGTTLYSVYGATAGGGASIVFHSPIRLSFHTGLYVICGTSGANVRASASGYRATT